MNECVEALKKFNKNKSPGMDGLTAEFYLRFWNELGKVMVDSFNFALQVFSLFRKDKASFDSFQRKIRIC